MSYLMYKYDVDPDTSDRVSCAEFVFELFIGNDISLELKQYNIKGLNRVESMILSLLVPSLKNSIIKDCKIPLPDSFKNSPSFFKVGRFFYSEGEYKYESF